MRKMVWSQPSIKHSFFKNSFGEVHMLSPWRLVDYWTWTREPDPDDFVIRLTLGIQLIRQFPVHVLGECPRVVGDRAAVRGSAGCSSCTITRKFIGL